MCCICDKVHRGLMRVYRIVSVQTEERRFMTSRAAVMNLTSVGGKEMRKRRIWTAAAVCMIFAAGSLAAAAQDKETEKENGVLRYESSLELEYADCFQIDCYEGGYREITVRDTERYLVVPEDMPVPEGLDEDIVVLQQPLENVYVAAAAAMDSFLALEEIEKVRFSGTKKDGWCDEAVQEDMENGDILYAGKYSEPDYELLLSEKCSLAVESTMIHHAPEAEEKLKELGIPVFVDQSSYEEDPLGRTEWMKLYAVLLDKEELAAELFEEQKESVAGLGQKEDTEKTVAFFFFNDDGNAVVRTSDDYIVKMIEMAGGRYAFELPRKKEQTTATVQMDMEQFYLQAKDADILIYSETMDEGFDTLEDMTAASSLLSDFKAVKEKNVWSCGPRLLQTPTKLGQAVRELNLMLTEEGEEEMEFFRHLK